MINIDCLKSVLEKEDFENKGKLTLVKKKYIILKIRYQGRILMQVRKRMGLL